MGIHQAVIQSTAFHHHFPISHDALLHTSCFQEKPYWNWIWMSQTQSHSSLQLVNWCKSPSFWKTIHTSVSLCICKVSIWSSINVIVCCRISPICDLSIVICSFWASTLERKLSFSFTIFSLVYKARRTFTINVCL